MDNALFVVIPIEGKGMGLKATALIPKGTRIIGDKPLIVFSTDGDIGTLNDYRELVKPKVAKLKKPQRDLYMSLGNVYKLRDDDKDEELGIARTSALPLDSAGIRHGVFPNASRLNHSCTPNSFCNWNEAIGRFTVHAIRDISQGEEITIHYFSPLESRADRHQRQLKCYRFICTCTTCRSTIPETTRRDKLLAILQKHIYVFDSGHIDTIKIEDGNVALRQARELIAIATASGIVNTIISDVYKEAAIITAFHGDQARATIFARKAYETRLDLEGPDSVLVNKLKKFMHNHPNNPKFAQTDHWKSKPGEVPTNVSAENFEAWLWRTHPIIIARNKAALRPILADLNDTALFPHFSKLPLGEEADPTYWVEDEEEAGFRPRKFWCFIGEIETVVITDRVYLIVRDTSGAMVHVRFFTDHVGFELGLGRLAKGNAIAIIHAEQRHLVTEEGRGIVQTAEGFSGVYPMSLERLLHLGGVAQKYAIEDNYGRKKCLGCDEISEHLKLHCSQCKMMYYCSKECQVRAWNEKGHKEDCPQLASREVSSLLCCAWDVFV